MQSEWIFIDKDGNCTTCLIEIENIPSRGDGKIHNGKSYEVLGAGTEMLSKKYPLIVAKEI